MKPIATDNYDFERLITDGYAYVDKTDMLWKLANGKNGTLFFISRPRRFGKSLMLSTFKYLFQGKRKLFKGLKIEKKKWDWSKTYPVIDLNMSDYDQTPGREAFREALCDDLESRLDASGIPYKKGASAPVLFKTLIKGLAAANEGDQKVVVLIDEYDHPLGGLLDDRKALRTMRREMHGFYSTLKNNVGVIRFRPEYAALLGYTVKEIETVLSPQLKAFARKRRISPEEAIDQLCAWYDSYRFSPYSNVRVLNPVAVGNALMTGNLMNYWSKTGMPTLILERLQASNMKPDAIDDVYVKVEDLDVCDAEELPWKPLLYQSGYLTIKKVHWSDEDGRHVEGLTLGMPNREVRESLRSLWWKQLMKIEEKDFTALDRGEGLHGARRSREEATGGRRRRCADERDAVFALCRASFDMAREGRVGREAVLPALHEDAGCGCPRRAGFRARLRRCDHRDEEGGVRVRVQVQQEREGGDPADPREGLCQCV